MTTQTVDENPLDEEITREQEYFDRAWEARERTRRTLGAAAGAAAGGKASMAVGRAAKAHSEQLGAPDEPVAIGRFDLERGDVMYVGKHVLVDEDGDPLVISWKAPAAARYFTASFDDPQGLRLRRTFELDRNHVVSFEDLVFADLASRVESLTGLERQGIDDSVLRDLEASRTGEMRDIVQTIHAAQYELVRSPLDELLVIQGGPGTGKTVVALHRVSWLLYNHRDELNAGEVLVIGPNPTFTRYIKSVLPCLGDADVAHLDLRALGPQGSAGRTEMAAVERLKGDARMARLLTRAMAQRVRWPERAERLEVGAAQAPFAVLDRDEVEAAYKQNLQSAASYMSGRAAMRTWMTNTVATRARWGVTVPAPAIDLALERVWPSLSPQAFLRELLGSRDRLLAAAGESEFTAAEVQLLSRPSAERISDERWSDADVALLDEADFLLNGTPRKYRHIVVDEAQDLSPMQLRSVRRRSRSGSYTLVGDLAQSTGAWTRDSWDDVAKALQDQCPEHIAELSLGYRVPQQVFALAAKLLPTAAPGVAAPQVVRLGPAEPDMREVDFEDIGDATLQAARDHAAHGLFVGIVCPDECRSAVVAALESANVQYKDARSGSLGTSINLVDAHEAKGLEFEAVVVVEPQSIVDENPQGLRLLYVALTRTTKYLTVVHSGPVLPIPGVDDPDDISAVPVTSLEALDEAAENLSTGHLPESSPARPLVGGLPALPGMRLEGELDLELSGSESDEPPVGAGAPAGPPLPELPDLPEPPVVEPAMHPYGDGPDGASPTVSAPPAPGPLDDLSAVLVNGMAARLAEHVATAAQPALWTAIVDRLRDELDRRRTL